jgi:choline dehydrogenase
MDFSVTITASPPHLTIDFFCIDNSTSVSTVAGGAQSFLNGTHLFQIPSVPQPGMNNRTQLVVLGKMLGGSSAANGMGYLRGQIEDYDSWASLWDWKSDWNWKGLLPYFKKVWLISVNC